MVILPLCRLRIPYPLSVWIINPNPFFPSMKQCMDSENLHVRMRKIQGQLAAIDRMIDEDVPCEDIIIQVNAVKSALQKVGHIIMEGHIQHCVREGIEHGDADKTIQEFTKALEQFSRIRIPECTLYTTTP
jgi:DNA-binding FrmR family transcriptional regulator